MSTRIEYTCDGCGTLASSAGVKEWFFIDSCFTASGDKSRHFCPHCAWRGEAAQIRISYALAHTGAIQPLQNFFAARGRSPEAVAEFFKVLDSMGAKK